MRTFNKVVPKGFKHPDKSNTLLEEYHILKKLNGLTGVPKIVSFKNNMECLQCQYIKGQSIDIYNKIYPLKIISILIKLSDIVTRINKYGIYHRDFRHDNILIDADDNVYLVDYDQAIIDKPGRNIDFACLRNKDGVRIGLRFLTDNYLKLSPKINEAIKNFEKIWEIGKKSNANAPEHNICYYSWDFMGHHFDGERDWLTRWDPIYNNIKNELKGKKILELGCNLGLLSSYCIIHGAEKCIGVDCFQDILDAASLFAKTLNIDSCSFIKTDLNNPTEYKKFNNKFDLVIALSVMNWVKNKKVLQDFLSKQQCILYEGHERVSKQKGLLDGTELLKSLGFNNIKTICKSERGRLIYLAKK